MSNNIEIGIVDTRNIVKIINEKYGFDFTNYALTSLKRRFERIIDLHNLKNPDNLITKLNETPEYFEKFMRDFLVETTEMFRDPSLWRWLRDSLLLELVRHELEYTIWLPDCVGGDELYSLCIMLKESNITDKVKVIASSINEAQIDIIKSGITSIKKLETGIENYKRFNGFGDFNSYYSTDPNFAYRDKTLVNNVDFRVINILKGDLPRQINLILYRNHFIYFNQTLQDNLTTTFYGCLKNGGHFVIGNMEMLGRQFMNEFVLINHAESVYKKR